MIQDIAKGVSAASAWTRVHALVADAGSGLGTVVVQNALWPATSVRIALIVWQTGARASVALGVWSTR